jgi:hypothetical protein
MAIGTSCTQGRSLYSSLLNAGKVVHCHYWIMTGIVCNYTTHFIYFENIHNKFILLPSGSISSFKSMNSNECLIENWRTSLVNAEIIEYK